MFYNIKIYTILNYLTKKSGFNIQENGTIEITSNSANCKLKNLVDLKFPSFANYQKLFAFIINLYHYYKIE